jgi:hypothetical protein
MKPLLRQILIGISGCVALTLVFSYSLSIAVNYGIAKFEEQTGEFLPGTSPNDSKDPAPLGQ